MPTIVHNSRIHTKFSTNGDDDDDNHNDDNDDADDDDDNDDNDDDSDDDVGRQGKCGGGDYCGHFLGV